MSDTVNIQDLKDLGSVVETAKAHVRDFTRPAEFGISAAFAKALKVAFPDYSFEFYERTVKVATPGKQYIYVSGQSFALAVCLMDFCEEIGRYRTIAYLVLNRYRDALEQLLPEQGKLDDKVFTALRDKANNQLTETFTLKVKEFFESDCDDTEVAAKNTDLLMRFLTDYSWWLGGKQISRSNDWCISPISTLLNMPQNDSNFIARVVSKATEDTAFRDAFKNAIEREWSGNMANGSTTASRSNEDRFKSWLTAVKKSNGEAYSENTRNQYISALKAVGTAFADAIAPFASIFEIDNIESFEQVAATIKAVDSYEDFNRNRGNGSLSAGLDLYKRFLFERNDTNNMFTPEWFQEKASEYPTLDEEAKRLLAEFQAKFAPDFLASLSGVEMLNTIFLNASLAKADGKPQFYVTEH